MWEVQRDDGAWSWLAFGLEPWEAGNDDWGAAMAALTVGLAPASHRAAHASEISRLVDYLHGRLRDDTRPLRDFDQLPLLWASHHLRGLMTSEQQRAVIDRVVALQARDGAWSTRQMIGRDGTAVDGIATGLATFVLCHVTGDSVAVQARPDAEAPALCLFTRSRCRGGSPNMRC